MMFIKTGTDYVEVSQRNGNITIKRRYPKIRMSKKQRIKKRWEGHIRFNEPKNKEGL